MSSRAFDRLFALRHKARKAGYWNEREWRFRVSWKIDGDLRWELAERSTDRLQEEIRTVHDGRIFGILVAVDQNLEGDQIALEVQHGGHAQNDGSVMTVVTAFYE